MGKADEVRKLIIIGGGPAGHTAAIYAARANLEPLLFEGFNAGGLPAGGQLMTTTEVENYPGFVEKITGPELMERFKGQAMKQGAEVAPEDVRKVDLSIELQILAYHEQRKLQGGLGDMADELGATPDVTEPDVKVVGSA